MLWQLHLITFEMRALIVFHYPPSIKMQRSWVSILICYIEFYHYVQFLYILTYVLIAKP